MRRWSQPPLKAAEGQQEAAASAAGDVLHAHLFECFPNVVVVVVCSHTSLNRSAREAFPRERTACSGYAASATRVCPMCDRHPASGL